MGPSLQLKLIDRSLNWIFKHGQLTGKCVNFSRALIIYPLNFPDGATMKRKPMRSKIPYEHLESRQLLAGDVNAILAGGSLILSGDRADNEVLVTTNDAGDVEVSGQNGTTINGEDQFVAETNGAVLNDLQVYLRSGNDKISIEDISIENRVTIRGGGGSDSIGLLRADIGDDLRIDSGARGDFISLDTVEIGDDLITRGRGGEDVIGIDNSRIDGRTVVDSGARDDRIAIRDSVHDSSVRISTLGGSDFVSSDGLTTNSQVRIFVGGRSDNVFVNDSNFNDRVFVRGHGGNDTLEVTGETTFGETPRVVSFEGDDVPGGLPQTDLVFTDLIAAEARLGTIVELAVMTPELSTLVGALVATGLDAAVAEPGPFTVFAPLNSAFDAISDVVGGLSNEQLTDVLLFHVVDGAVFAEELVTLDSVSTLLGQSFDVDVSDGVVLNGNATLAATDIRAKNGVIHLLNDVLVPAL